MTMVAWRSWSCLLLPSLSMSLSGAFGGNVSYGPAVKEGLMAERKERSLLMHGVDASSSNDTFHVETQDSSAVVERMERNSYGITLDPSTHKYKDSFGDQVSFAYYGGYVLVECTVKASTAECSTEKLFLVSPTGKTVSPTQCVRGPVEMKLQINENTEFGEYRCQFKGVNSAESIGFNYRICGDNESVCLSDVGNVEGCSNDDIFACLVTAKSVNRCADLTKADVFNPSRCLPESNAIYCPGNHKSICHYETWGERRTAREHPTTRFASNAVCSNHVNSLLMYFSAVRARYASTFAFPWDTNKPPRVRCDVLLSNVMFQVDCQIVAQNGSEIEIAKTHCSRMEWVIDAHIFLKEKASLFTHNGLEIFKLRCIFSERSTVVGDVTHTMVSFGLPMKPKVTLDQTDDKKYMLAAEPAVRQNPRPRVLPKGPGKTRGRGFCLDAGSAANIYKELALRPGEETRPSISAGLLQMGGTIWR